MNIGASNEMEFDLQKLRCIKTKLTFTCLFFPFVWLNTPHETLGNYIIQLKNITKLPKQTLKAYRAQNRNTHIYTNKHLKIILSQSQVQCLRENNGQSAASITHTHSCHTTSLVHNCSHQEQP